MKPKLSKWRRKQKEENKFLGEIRDIFSPLETLTDELINELVRNGQYPLERLEEARDNGLSYNRARNSFMDEGFVGL